MTSTESEKTITAYCDPISLRAGERVRLMASSHRPGSAGLTIERITCGDPSRSGPGFATERVALEIPSTVELRNQAITPGSFATCDLSRLRVQRRIHCAMGVYLTRPNLAQTIWSLDFEHGEGLALGIDGGGFIVRVDGKDYPFEGVSPQAKRWYQIAIDYDIRNGEIYCSAECLVSRSPGADFSAHLGHTSSTIKGSPSLASNTTKFWLAADAAGARFDGRISNPRLDLDDVQLKWDFGQAMNGRELIEVSGHGRHGLLHQLPARAITGPDWDGRHHDWTQAPCHYNAVHFHSDDIYDAEWSVSAEAALPTSLASGIYCFTLRQGEAIDRVPFFVRPAVGRKAADIALLMPTCTYMAYANHRMLFEGADFVAARSRLRPEHAYIRDHREVGPSMYEHHDDGSGVMYSSRRRPILQLRPGADGWNFTPDTNINAFLEHLKVNHDILSDEDLHAEGLAALAHYRVIVTGTHPEYWSTRMLEALEAYLRQGGRLMYLGGNGFYWRVAFSDSWPGAIELRRAEDGVRNWQTEAGESYHSFNGEYGGLWRRLGRPPNALVGVGFAAQGFERAVGYRRSKESYSARFDWVFKGVESENIGTSGLGGGAAGQEVDRFNLELGSPPHAAILASATEFGPDMTRTKEELDAAIIVPDPDPVVRADCVFFETPENGAVFSVGSIAWFGALARNGYANDIAQMTENVVRRFLDETPFGER